MQAQQQVKICLVGTGALASLFAAKFCEHSSKYAVSMLGNSHKMQVEHISQFGLQFTNLQKQVQILHPFITTQVQRILPAEQDVIIFLVKSFQTQDAVLRIRKHLSAKCVLTLQNGIGNAEWIQQQYPDSTFVGVTSHGAQMMQLGHVVHTGPGFLKLAALHAKDAASVTYLTQLFDDIGMPAEGILDANKATSMLWQKLVINACINPIAALHRETNGALLQEKYQVMVKQVYAEVMQVAKQLQIELPSNMFDMVLQVMKNTPNNSCSMLADVQNKRQTEIDQINGAIVKHAQELGIAVPMNQSLVSQIHSLL